MQNPARSSLEHFAPNATQRIQGTIRVRATRRGFFDNHVIEPGTVFMIREQDKLGSWMEIAPDETPVADANESNDAKGDDPSKSGPSTERKRGKKSKPAETSGEKSEDDVL